MLCEKQKYNKKPILAKQGINISALLQIVTFHVKNKDSFEEKRGKPSSGTYH